MFTRSVVVPTVIEIDDLEYSRAMELEIHSMIRAEEDMMLVYNQIVGLEEEYKMLLKAKQTSQYHQQLEVERDRKIIADSRGNIETLLGQLSLYTSEANNIHNENLQALQLCKKKSLEIEELRNKNIVLEKNNSEEFKDRQKLQNSINREKAVKAGIENQCVELTRLLQDNLAKLQILEKEQIQLERENAELAKIRLVAQRDADALAKQKLQRQISSQKTNIALNEAIKTRQQAKLQLADLQNQNKLVQNQHAKLVIKLQKQLQNTGRLESKLKSNLKNISLAEREFDQTQNINNSLRQQNAQLGRRNLDLNDVVKTQIRQIQSLELQNDELKRQIDVFLACQDQARKILNHRAPFEVIVGNVNQQLNTSGKIISYLR